MALTQTARLPGPGPSWDEDVVPVLRKRLENESRTLARRISAISASSSTEDLDSTNYYNNSNYSHSTTARPTTTSRTHSNSSVAPSQSSHRSRTNSQPYRVNGINGTPSTPTSSSAIRSISPRPSTSNSNPYIDSPHTKPSRIPQPVPATRTRAASITGHTQFPSPTNSSHHTIPVPIPGYGYGSPTTPTQDTSRSADLWIVHEASPHASASTSFPSSASSSITSTQRGQALLNEPAPFKPGTGYSPSSSVNHSHENGIGFPYTNGTSRRREDEDEDSEEEEHPFEHWYRGEISRNGGVGELRVGKRQEMLEIANYGHDLSSQGKKQNAITEAIEERRRQRERAGRRRADSMGSLGERASFYMDPDKAKEVARVLDENPLTDFEDQDEFSADGHDRYYRGHGNDMNVDDDTYHGERMKTPTLMAPAYRRGQSEPLYSGSGSGAKSSPSLGLNSTPQQGRSGAAKGTKSPSTPSQSQNQRSGQRSRATSATKRAASTSPGPSLPGTPSKSPSATSRMQASKATQAKLAAAKRQKLLEESKRGSVATYDLSTEGVGDDMANAIPTWTQPVPREGNWDDVVLPVVARKKGLDGHFETADGSPRAVKANQEGNIVPAPGTFGYDHSKYRPPRDISNPEEIPMDEFGQPKPNFSTSQERSFREDDEEDEEGDTRRMGTMGTAHDETRLPVHSQQQQQQMGPGGRTRQYPQPPTSPVPFSEYAPRPRPSMEPSANGQQGQGEVDLEAQRHKEQMQMQQQEVEDGGGGGCCKCVIM